MKAKGSATRPELARALGISLVRINALVSRLSRRGMLKATREKPSRGGRPSRVYTYQAGYGMVAHFQAESEPPHFLAGRLEWLDMEGRLLGKESARFTLLHKESLDAWIERKKDLRLHGICLTLPSGGVEWEQALKEHLRERYKCPVQHISTAAALCPRKEKSLALHFRQGKNPQGAHYQGGKILECGMLHLLPALVLWERVDYDDHTQVEEMVALLLQSLTCCMAPEQIYLFGDFWTERLEKRIRYNIGIKLQRLSVKPKLHFRHMDRQSADTALRRACIDFSS